MHQKSCKNASKITPKIGASKITPLNWCVKNHPLKLVRQKSPPKLVRQKSPPNLVRQKSPLKLVRQKSPCVIVLCVKNHPASIFHASKAHASKATPLSPGVEIPASQFRVLNVPCVISPLAKKEPDKTREYIDNFVHFEQNNLSIKNF